MLLEQKELRLVILATTPTLYVEVEADYHYEFTCKCVDEVINYLEENKIRGEITFIAEV